MRGRRPKPTRLKILSGNPGKRALNMNEPKPDPEIPECPVELGPVARKEWDRLVVQLGALRLLTQLDRAALAAYCGAYGMWAEATEAIQKYGTMVKSPTGYPVQSPAMGWRVSSRRVKSPTGYPVQSPYVSIANRQAEIMMRIATEFGFTPASRSRISTPPPQEFDLFSPRPANDGQSED